MMKMQKAALSTDKNDRRRGRPAGKNRTPLSQEERRARNAQYERERRNETADAMAQLAEAACCDPQIANAELLATVISQLQRRAKRKSPENIDDLKRTNQNLESQIAALQSRLGQESDLDDSAEDINDCAQEQLSDSSILQTDEIEQRGYISHTREAKSKSNIQPRKELRRSNKIRKTSKSSSVCEKTSESDSDTQSDTSSNSDWSESQAKTEPTQYKLRSRCQTASEQSEHTTSTYLYRTESESSHCGTRPLKTEQFEDSNQPNVLEHPTNVPNDPILAAIPEQIEEFKEHYDDQTETMLLEKLTEGEKRIINEWLDTSETVNVRTDHEINQVRKFLDFDDFLLDINA